MYFHLYFWMYFHEFKYSIPLVPVGIPSIDLYFFTIFVCAFSCNWGWLVSAGTLRWWPLKKYIWDQDLPSPTSVQYNYKVSQYGVLLGLSRWPKGQFGRRRLQLCILNVFCLSTIVFAYVTQIKSTYLLTVQLLSSRIFFGNISYLISSTYKVSNIKHLIYQILVQISSYCAASEQQKFFEGNILNIL